LKPAITARRTSRSSNGGIVVFIEIQRAPPLGASWICSLRRASALCSTAGGGGCSPLIMLLPSRTRRDASAASSLPSRISISSR
jgi:hypothetical protein